MLFCHVCYHMRQYLVFTLLILLPITVLAQEEGWKFIRDDDSIRVYSRKSQDSPINEIKVVTEMQTDLSSLVALMKDVDNHKNWAYANKKARILEKHNEFSWVFYGYSDAPWPVQDRDMVVNSTLRQDSATRVVTNTGNCNPDFVPEKQGVVRIPDCHSKWTLKPVDENLVQVSLQIRIDLGGMLPAWLINMVSSKGPYQTLKNMEEEVKKPEYRDAEVEYIMD